MSLRTLFGLVVLAQAQLAAHTPPAPAPAPAPAPVPIDWWSEDSGRVAALTASGVRYAGSDAILWAPRDSVDSTWLRVFVDSLSTGVRALRQLMGGTLALQRLGPRPVTFYLSPGRFVSHASGDGSVFISLGVLRRGVAPFLHEAAHELLAPTGDFFPDEYGDSSAVARAEALFPFWLNEGLPDYLAQLTAQQTGFREGDVFAIGGLGKVDSVCAARLASTLPPHRDEILDKIGRGGRLAALATTDRPVIAPVYYACSQSFTKSLVERVGVRAVVELFPEIPKGTWRRRLEAAAGGPLESLRRDWLARVTARPPP